MLSKQTLEKLCSGEKPLVENLIDPKNQIQANGVDFTLNIVEKIKGKATIDFDNSRRVISDTEKIEFSKFFDEKKGVEIEYIDLEKGVYKITFNEIVNMPLNIGAIAKTRSSLMRSGVIVDTSIWDAGYRGRSNGMLEVKNPEGIRFLKNAKVVQLVFFFLDEITKEGYNGVYQSENL